MLSFLLSVADEREHSKIEYIYNTYHDDMLRLAKCRLRNMGSINYELDAEDVVQNTFLKITTYIDNINIHVGYKALRSYVFSIVLNEAVNLMNANKAVEELDDCEVSLQDDAFIQALNIRQRYDEVVARIEKLEEIYRYTMKYYFYDSMSAADIAKLMGVAEKTVYTRLNRGKKLLLISLEAGKDYV